MKYDFDRVIERRGTDSYKWKDYGDDVLPMWVADMDFVSAEPIIQVLHQRIDHGIFGYTRPTLELRTVIQERRVIRVRPIRYVKKRGRSIFLTW